MLRAFVFAGSAAVADAAQWAVIVAGSNTYMNYRHQADACHAHQIVKAKGIPAENIIHMAYDDIASSPENPFKGKLFNKPDVHGPGRDVYAGCHHDYTGDQVIPDNFVAVLTGDGSKGKTLKSTADDDVFVYFTDHGAPGLIAFPNYPVGVLHKNDLQKALKTMADKKMFKKLVFYLETCESGSMFEGLDVPGVYAVSAANAKESSWGSYCGKDAVVNGKNLMTCLGDLFSVSWMNDVDNRTGNKETLQESFSTVKVATAKSHVMQWGDLSFTSDPFSEFIGEKGSSLRGPATDVNPSTSAVSARSIHVDTLYWAYSSAKSTDERLYAGERLQALLGEQQAAELTFRKFTQIAVPGDADKQSMLWHAKESPRYAQCETLGHVSFVNHCQSQFNAKSAFALQFHQVVVNVCAEIARGLNLDVVSAVQQSCAAGKPEEVLV